VVEDYHEMTRLIERLHRRFLDVLRAELILLDITDINAVQALLLANIGEEEISVKELVSRGYYQGSNASYNLKKLVEMDYLIQKQSERDRRASIIRLSDKGLELVKGLEASEGKHADMLKNSNPSPDLSETRKSLRQIERVWTEYILYGDPAGSVRAATR
jgi:MarR family transcriptional regulator, exopolysaccharide II synthesis transcriptional activator